MRISELLEKLEPVKNCDGYINFDFGGATPISFDSYRGYYERLAISYSGDHGVNKTPKEFYSELRSCIGKVFIGWKGGNFQMNENTLLHVACSGCVSETIIKDVEINYYHNNRTKAFVTLITEEIED